MTAVTVIEKRRIARTQLGELLALNKECDVLRLQIYKIIGEGCPSGFKDSSLGNSIRGSRKQRPTLLQLEKVKELRDTLNTMYEDRAAKRVAMLVIIDAIPEAEYRAVLMQRYGEGYKVSEIPDLNGESYDSTKHKIKYALEAFYDAMMRKK